MFGITRDSALLWFAVLGAALAYLVTAQTPPNHWTYMQWLQALSAAALWGSGKLQNSPVPSSGEVNRGIRDNGKILAFVLMVALSAGAFTMPACAKAPPSLSPAGVSAFNALRVGHSLDIIRDVARDANHQSPPLVSRASLLKIVDWHEAAVKTIVAVPSGWKPTVLASLDALKGAIPDAEWQKIALYVSLLKTVIAEVGSGSLTGLDTGLRVFRSELCQLSCEADLASELPAGRQSAYPRPLGYRAEAPIWLRNSLPGACVSIHAAESKRILA